MMRSVFAFSISSGATTAYINSVTLSTLDLLCSRVNLCRSGLGVIRIVSNNDKLQKRREFRAFLFLTIVLAPLLSAVIVGGFGFLVWMYQLMAGPPGS